MPILHTNNLVLSFANGSTTKPIHLHIKPGERWGILGTNGCGKTTLLKHLAGLNHSNNPCVFLDNQPLSAYPTNYLAQQIGFLAQHTDFPFPQTVWQYCAHSRYAHQSYWRGISPVDKKIVENVLTQLQLERLAYRRVDQLSGGEKRRVAIAALCAQAPSIYLMDEPTNHLDIPHQMLILHYFKYQTAPTSACVMALHDLNHAQQFCSHILMIFPSGEIMAGPRNEILTPARVSRLFHYPITAFPMEDSLHWCLKAVPSHAIPLPDNHRDSA